MKTYIPKEEDFDRKTYLIDASGKVLGRLAVRVAGLLLGKGKACFAYDKLCGDQVVVINAKEIYVTGNKREQKHYKRYSGYPSGLKETPLERMLEKKPDEVILQAVKRMLPKNKLGREMLKRLRVYGGAEHRQQAQKPIALEV